MGLNTLIDPTVPDLMISSNRKEMMKREEHELAYISTEYDSVTDEMNERLTKINRYLRPE